MRSSDGNPLPEFTGRIGAFLVFLDLSERTRAEIIALSVSRIAEEYGLTVERVAPTVIAHLLTLSDKASTLAGVNSLACPG
jgi:ATP-dependent Clp protease ATP-binding subunit ClpA